MIDTATAGAIQAELPSRFAALDIVAIQSRFTRSTERPGITEAFMAIEGMTCAACAQSIRERLMRLPGIESVAINVAAGAANLRWCASATPLSAVFSTIAALGYKPFPADDYLALARQQCAHKTLLWQFLVALLAMMQTMMYAWPRYVAAPGELSDDLNHH